MFRCIVSVVCTDILGRVRTFQREIHLPFVPTPLVELGFAAHDCSWSGEVTAVVYDVGADTYHVEMGDWDGPGMTLDEMLAELGPEWRPLGKAA